MESIRTLETIRTVDWMKQVTRDARLMGRVVGFVPTMGALHEGHISLVRVALADCRPVVSSIFVNPTQFGPKEDFKKYPRHMSEDTRMLSEAGVDYLFAPEPEEIYLPGFRTWVNVDGLSDRLEGRIRPGHFRGVTTVVLKLLEIVRPDKAYFGRKDAQQARLIRQMARDLHLDTEIVVCPIVREPDGLALSSRNAYLSPEERRAAAVLHRALTAMKAAIDRGDRDALALAAKARDIIRGEALASIDYIEVVDYDSFEPVTFLRGNCIALLAVRFGNTRLIDNLQVEERSGTLHVTL